MPEFTEATTGRFCWVELQTKDPIAARKFYGELFGWQFDEMPMPGGTYAMAKLGGKQVAGLMALPPAAAQGGRPRTGVATSRSTTSRRAPTRRPS